MCPHLLKLKRILQHHGLLAGYHLGGNVVVKVCALLEHQAVAVEAPCDLDLRQHLTPHGEAQRLQLPDLCAGRYTGKGRWRRAVSMHVM